MRIYAPKTLSSPVAEGQEIASITNRRVPRDLLSDHGPRGALPPLEIGQELEADVLDELDDGRLLLKVGVALLEADAPSGIEPGQHVRLRVEQLHPQVVLQITDVELTVEAEAARLLRAHLPAHAEAGQLFDLLQTELNSLSGAPGISENLTKLRDAIASLLMKGAPSSSQTIETMARNGGLFYEAKLLSALAHGAERLPQIAQQDLKGLLLAALKESQLRELSTGLRHALSAQLENVETQQAVNLLAQINGGAFQMQIPLFTGLGFATAAVAVEPDNTGQTAKSRGQNGYYLLFLLDLENFGRTRIEVHVNGAALRAVFYVDRPDSLGMITQALPEFHEILKKHGYRDVLLAGKSLKEMPQAKRDKFAALAVGAPISAHLLDMKA